MSRMKWKAAAVVMSSALVLSACGSGSESGSDGGDKSFTMTTYPGSVYGVYDVLAAQDMEAKGYDVEYATGVGPDMVASLIGGSSDFASAPYAVAGAVVNQGQCLEYIANGQGNMYDIIASPDFDLPNLEKGWPAVAQDLEGARMGVAARGGAIELFIREVLSDAGVDPDSLNYVTTGGVGTSVTALQEGQVDLLAAFPPIQATLGEGNYQEVVDLVAGSDSDALDGLMVGGTAVNCDFAKDNPEIIADYCDSLEKAAALVADPARDDEIVPVIASMLSVDEDLAQQAWDRARGSFSGLEITEEQWDLQTKFYPSLEEMPDFGSTVKQCGA